MGYRVNSQGGLKFMTLGSMKRLQGKYGMQSLIPDNVILQVNAFGQGQPNDIYFLGRKKSPIGELDITEVDSW